MAFECRILADSVSPCGVRLTTFEATYPRSIHSEIMTHRQLSRNAASSRAIPVEKLIQRVEDDPFVPEFRLNKKGMQAGENLEDAEALEAVSLWLSARDNALREARRLHALNIHKQYVNRLLEPWMWITVIVSATEWANFFSLRCHPDAEPSFQRIATMMYREYAASVPDPVGYGGWHLPLVRQEDWDDERLQIPGAGKDEAAAATVSAGRCARVSYLTHDGRRDIGEDIALYQRLGANVHMSPLEHAAVCATHNERDYGNFRAPWLQLRKMVPNECFTTFPELPEEATE